MLTVEIDEELIVEEGGMTIETKNLRIINLQKIKRRIQAQRENLKIRNLKKLSILKLKKILQIIKSVQTKKQVKIEKLKISQKKVLKI